MNSRQISGCTHSLDKAVQAQSFSASWLWGVTILLLGCAASLWSSTGFASVHFYPLQFSPQTMALTAIVKGKSLPLIEGIGYSARFREKEEAFYTEGVDSVTANEEGQRAWILRFRLAGPAAEEAHVICQARFVSPHCLQLHWEIEYTGPERSFFGWTDGLRLNIPQKPFAARSRPLIKWIKPVGRYDWEVPGDTPYPQCERQLREIKLKSCRLILLTSWYDPDWLYGGDLKRVSFLRLGLPARAPQKIAGTMEIIAAPESVSDEDMLAAAAAEPLSVAVSTGKGVPVRAPGQPLGFTVRLANVDSKPQTGRLRWNVYDYYGQRVAGENLTLALAPGQSRVMALTPRVKAQRGIYFLAGELALAQGQRRLLRAFLACLPPRPVNIEPSSPFGMAALACQPERYPDQPNPEVALAMMARIGVHWLRGGGFRIAEDIRPEEVEAARREKEQLRKWGILLHVQTFHPAPQNEAEAAAFRRRLMSALTQFGFLSPYVEVGNELNYSVQATPYVQYMLRPQYEAMRAVFPEGKVMNAGLGGVNAQWWREFVEAGGLDYVDALSVHPGHHPRAPEFWEGWDGWVLRPQMQRVFDTLSARPLNSKEVWVTEAYSPSSPHYAQLDMRTAADYLVRTYCLLLALGARVIEWYQFRDGTWFSAAPKPDDLEYNYGIVFADLSPKPQYVAYGVMTVQLEGTVCLGRLALGAEDLYGLRFRRRTGEQVDVLWSYRERHECDLAWWPPEKFIGRHRRAGEPWQERWKAPVEVLLPAAAPNVAVTDIMGNVRQVRGSGGQVRLRLTGSPLYVRGLGDIPVSRHLW